MSTEEIRLAIRLRDRPCLGLEVLRSLKAHPRRGEVKLASRNEMTQIRYVRPLRPVKIKHFPAIIHPALELHAQLYLVMPDNCAWVYDALGRDYASVRYVKYFKL